MITCHIGGAVVISATMVPFTCTLGLGTSEALVVPAAVNDLQAPNSIQTEENNKRNDNNCPCVRRCV